ncbi:hypothetical protein NEFER03_1395 [Nematocida sp. LUAm3]|nr:hypothetical protein NEFER03_1395 [Nematocida sp. LUAm3]KAI5174775.1 hypothetical protein NEFER02_0885 [Nematocida sp. LUAm2]KAI5177814.1 hypothetical protein NEFER01_1016 [Nematocida sp. LUAm1]
MERQEPDPEIPKEKGLSKAEAAMCKGLLMKLKKSTHAAPFLFPVDPQIPDYYDKIKHPMDLSTVSKKIDQEEYESLEEVKKDIELIFSNCFLYNAVDSPVHKMGSTLEKYFKQLVQKGALDKRKSLEEEKDKKKIKTRSMPEEEYTKCMEILNELTKPKHRRFNWPFLEKVDGNLVPTYYTLIKNPMDLSTARSKLVGNKYNGISEFISDFNLIVSNCYIFNAEESEVYICATKINNLFKQLIDQKGKSGTEDVNKRIAELRELVIQSETEIRKLEKRAGITSSSFGYEEKKRLKKRIESLSLEKLRNVVSYIQQNIPSAIVNEMEELEVNLDLLDQHSLVEISEIVQNAYVEEQRIESDSSSSD